MKITHKAATIEDIGTDGIERIEIGTAKVQVILNQDCEAGDAIGSHWSLRELDNMITALQAAREALTGEPATRLLGPPRTWNAGDPVPDDVLKVIDGDDDVWGRESGELWTNPRYSPKATETLLFCYPPLTEVR